jgi:hypothetical protein
MSNLKKERVRPLLNSRNNNHLIFRINHYNKRVITKHLTISINKIKVKRKIYHYNKKQSINHHL